MAPSIRTSSRTYSAKKGDIQRAWHVVDVADKVLGRAASQIATLLKGKHKPTYTPSIDTGDHVIVINASKVKVTGNKATQKTYFKHTGYMGHESHTPFAVMIAKHPERVIEKAVYGMLPKNGLARNSIRGKLKVYAGADHPHVAQKPAALTFQKSETK